MHGAGDRLRAGARWPSGRRASAARGVTTLTLSTEQQALARQRAEDGRRRPTGSTSGCRTTATRRGQFDAIVSVEMIEAVGEAYWPTYFARDRPAAGARRPGRPAGDHHGPRPDAGHPPQLQLDPQVRVPRRDHPVDRGDRRTTSAAHTTLSIVRAPRPRPALRAHAGAVAGAVPRPTGTELEGSLRRHVPPDVGVLPRLLRGRLPRRLPRRQPAGPGPSTRLRRPPEVELPREPASG